MFVGSFATNKRENPAGKFASLFNCVQTLLFISITLTRNRSTSSAKHDADRFDIKIKVHNDCYVLEVVLSIVNRVVLALK